MVGGAAQLYVIILKVRMSKISKALQRQLSLNEGKNLLHAEVGHLLEIDQIFLAALEELVSNPKEQLSSDKLENMAEDAAASFASKIYAMNQYIQIDGHAKESLKQIYIESWQELVETQQVESTIRNHHYPRISAFVEAVYPESLSSGLRSAIELGRVPSSEYSAELQKGILRLELESIREPVLDIGCGAEGNLVRFMRSQKMEAYGIDRFIRNKTGYLIEADWFDYEYGLGKWGSIVSNLSLANHLRYALRYDHAKVPQYLKTFSKVLDSLSKGGTFTFAPAVEQLEKHIDQRQHRIEKWEISPGTQGMGVTRIAL